MTEQELIDMPLHTTEWHEAFSVMKVIGGWVYSTFYEDNVSSVFVPQKEIQYPLPKPKEVRGYFCAISDKVNDEENDKP